MSSLPFSRDILYSVGSSFPNLRHKFLHGKFQRNEAPLNSVVSKIIYEAKHNTSAKVSMAQFEDELAGKVGK